MEKTLSKHGKYWIITGTPEELYDNMHPGDIVKNFNGEWFELLHVADFSELSRELQAATWFFHPDSVWRAKDMQDGEEKYIQFHGYCPRKIKRPVEREESEKPEEPADQGHGEPRLPEEKGFYEDADGDLWYIDPDESEPRCYWFGFSCYWFDSSCYWVGLSTDKSYGDLQRRLQLHEMSIQQAKEYGPYRRVTRIRWETN